MVRRFDSDTSQTDDDEHRDSDDLATAIDSESSTASIASTEYHTINSQLSRSRSSSTCSEESSLSVSDAESRDLDYVDPAYKAHRSDSRESLAQPTGLNYGEQVTDDLLNSYADKVQAACGVKLEGFFAVQAVQIMANELKTHITGNHRAFQIILDSHRKHYVLLEYNPSAHNNGLRIYDSLMEDKEDFSGVLNKSLKSQCLKLFGQLYGKTAMPIWVEIFNSPQNDKWSCGLRVAAMITIRAFNLTSTPHLSHFDLKKFHKVFLSILNTKEPSIVDFECNSWFSLRPGKPVKYVQFIITLETFFVRFQNVITDAAFADTFRPVNASTGQVDITEAIVYESSSDTDDE